MRRASSQQRLAPLNACMIAVDKTKNLDDIMFDNTPPLCALLSDQDDSSQDSFRRNNRKRYRIKRQSSSEVSTCSYNGACDDIQLHIASFLDVSDGQVLMQIDRRRYKLIKKATKLWEQWCLQRWPYLPSDTQFIDTSCPSGIPDYSYFLGIASDMVPPTCIDKASFKRGGHPIFRSLPESATTVQYLNAVGTGDRCVRANKPLIRPVNQKRSHCFRLFSRNNRTLPKPYLSPFFAEGKIVLTPRLLSYFEVSILKIGPQTFGQRNADPARNISDCIAIGVSTRSFRWHARMPGWDVNSYGYHGDDGGIFHASGDMLRRFGPSFGKGDTIGCGVDYACAGIFFTINGKFLGYGWKDEESLAEKDLYPTVGIDSNAPVDCNFGQKDFKFDLCAFIRKRNDELQPRRRF